MVFSSNYELIDIADEYLAVPIGTNASSGKSVIVLSNAAAYLLKQLSQPKTKEELVDLLQEEYDVDKARANSDIDIFIRKMIDIGLIVL